MFSERLSKRLYEKGTQAIAPTVGKLGQEQLKTGGTSAESAVKPLLKAWELSEYFVENLDLSGMGPPAQARPQAEGHKGEPMRSLRSTVGAKVRWEGCEDAPTPRENPRAWVYAQESTCRCCDGGRKSSTRS
jgi:hypothetical protein